MKDKLTRVWQWLDDNILLCLSVFLIFFIPLWPKIPLADLLPGYIVRLRLEDIVVGIAFVIYLVQVWRGKINWKMPTWQGIFANIVLGLMSIACGLLILHTIPWGAVHIGKSLLHWARYIEYFFMAFLFFASIKNKNTLKIVAFCMLLTVSAISIYGMGQKYLYWPVYSTMNREFSKGMRLVLTPHARVQSTFGGHYDFAAYLVLLLPITLMIARHAGQIWKKPKHWPALGVWTAHILGLWSLIVSAARTSIIAYFAGAVIVITLDILYSKRSKGRKFGAWWGHNFCYFALVGLLIFGWGEDMIERFAHVLDKIQPLHDAYHTANKWRKELPYKLGWKQEWQPPENSVVVTVDDYGNNTVITPTDAQPKPTASTTRPVDVYVDVPDIKIGIDASGNAYMYEATRTWSVNAEKYGLSMAIRLDTLWPNAIAGFLRNPLLGSGYGMITKGESFAVFTEADSTDNNYLRHLGETGLLGALTFYGTIVYTIWTALKTLKRSRLGGRVVNIGYSAAAIGLLINALYIDVFAASKVAFTFWMIDGIFWASQQILLPLSTSGAIKHDKSKN